MRRGRLAPLGAALALAGGFVILRVLYRVVFGGSGGGGTVVFELPRIRLGGPFAHLTLFGPVTAEGVLASVVGALPFAALVVVSGLAATVLDPRAVLARAASRGPFRVVARALLVAFATLPALVDAVRRARLARELRGGRSAAGLVVPVLARTIERATAIGASMEVRGFARVAVVPAASADAAAAGAAGVGATAADAADLVDARGVAVIRDGRPVLTGLDLGVARGELVLLAGSTGSGKSTLLGTIDGLEPHVGRAVVSGHLVVAGRDRVATPPRDTADRVGSVAQDVRSAFVAATVAEEIGFVLAVRGDPPAAVAERVADVAEELGISALLDRDIHALSAGEAARVALAAATAHDPALLLVDEPLADLDADARDRVLAVLRARIARGRAVVVAEHRVDAVGPIATRTWHLDGGHLRGHLRETSPEVDVPLPRAPDPATGEPVARIRGLEAGYRGAPILRGVDLDLRAGEVVAIAGPNGVGKSTLLGEVARPSRREVVRVAGLDVAALRPRARRRVVALVPERTDDLFAWPSVADECERADRLLATRRGVEAGATRALVTELAGVGADDVEVFLATHPRDLSAGQRLCLALAIQSSAAPAVLLVDEPVRGLDAAARRLVAAAIARLATRGTAVVVATHDVPFAEAVAHRSLTLRDGSIEREGSRA